MSEPRTLAWESANSALIYEMQGPLAFITFNRPEKINALNREISEGLARCMEAYGQDDALRCAIISGAGGNFSSGGDLKEMNAYLEQARAEGSVHVYDAPHLRAMDRTYKPIIAALDGYCLAQAMFLAVLFCDIRIATPRVTLYSPPRTHTSFRLDANWGSGLFRGTIGMPLWWYMGFGNLMYMSLVKKQLGAEDALRWGLINEIVPVERLMDRAIELGLLISESSPISVRISKEFYRRNLQAVNGYDLDLRDALYRSAATS
jgi:enoyl-CoA hydratase/carnithine racemase